MSRLMPPSGGTVDYAFDAAGQLTALTHAGAFAAAYTYAYDQAGRLTRWRGDGPDDWTYAYDPAGRLTQARHGPDTYAYTYDPAGNRLDRGGVFDAANRLTEDAEYTYTYDPRGNLLEKRHKAAGARTRYAWDARDRLLRIERYPDAAATTPTETLAYAYGPLGRRWSRTQAGATVRFLYDGLDRLATLDSAGTLLEWVTFGPGIDEPLGRVDASSRRLWSVFSLEPVRFLQG